MTYIVTIKFPSTVRAADAEKVLRDQQADRSKRIVEDGQRQGCLHHMFVENPDGDLLVVDEWPDEATCRAFMEGQQDIPKVVQALGADPSTEPEIRSYRVLDTADRF